MLVEIARGWCLTILPTTLSAFYRLSDNNFINYFINELKVAIVALSNIFLGEFYGKKINTIICFFCLIVKMKKDEIK